MGTAVDKNDFNVRRLKPSVHFIEFLFIFFDHRCDLLQFLLMPFNNHRQLAACRTLRQLPEFFFPFLYLLLLQLKKTAILFDCGPQLFQPLLIDLHHMLIGNNVIFINKKAGPGRPPWGFNGYRGISRPLDTIALYLFLRPNGDLLRRG